MDPLQIRTARRLADLDPASWDLVTSRAPLFVKRPFLQALEDARPENVEPCYALLLDAGAVVAALAGQRLTVHVERAAPGGGPDGALARLARTALERVDVEVALWGNFLTWGHCGVAFAPGTDERTLWPRVAEAIYRISKEHPAFTESDLHLVLDVPPHQAEGAKHLEAHGFSAYATEPDMVLDLPERWRSFDDYQGALRTKYRKASVNMDRDLRAAGCTIERLADVESRADELFDLYHQVHTRSPHRFVTLGRGTIPALARRLGDRLICNAVSREGRLLGFGTTLLDGETAIAYFVGHDTEHNQELPIYLKLLQVAVADGISHGCRRVAFGRTALEPKARIGARPVPLTVYGRHRSRIVGALVSGFLQSLTPHEDPPERSPFKVAPGD